MAADEPDVRTLEVRGWLLRASEDLRAGKHDLTARPPHSGRMPRGSTAGDPSARSYGANSGTPRSNASRVTNTASAAWGCAA
jgi:hypothetical protein